MAEKTHDKTRKKFGTFGGVFTPSVLTILGVIMFLREGWVVGNAGFGGAALIILIARGITICTGLALSSMVTNIRIGEGGAYSIIARSLGLEAGGSIGIPLYLAQTVSAALYIIGFTEGWLYIFPGHNPHIVATLAWGGLLVVSIISADLAIKVEYFIMAVLGFSLLSFFTGGGDASSDVVVWGNFQDASFWQLYAIFFPAVTGMMAGVNMSGDLKDPKKNIPMGIMTSIFATLVIYLALAYFLDLRADSEALRANSLIMMDLARWGWAIMLGLWGATLSSALGSMVGAPRILSALGEHKIVPFASFFARKTPKGDPRNAVIVTGIIIEVCLLVGTLDTIAPLLTMFFLITYGMINFVVFVEQSLGIVSFRPTFRVPKSVSLIGGVGCVLTMFLVNPLFSVVSVIIIIGIYGVLMRRGLKAEWGDVRGGMFLAIAGWAVRTASRYPQYEKTWKPDLLVPIEDPKIWSGPLHFIRDITFPNGSVSAFTVQQPRTEEIERDLRALIAPLEREDVLTTSAVVEAEDFLSGATVVMQMLKAGFFRPNTIFLTMGDHPDKDPQLIEIVTRAKQEGLGVILLRQHPRAAFGMARVINLWLRDKSPNWNLAILLSLQLQRNWGGRINLLTSAKTKQEIERLRRFLNRLSEQARMPAETVPHVLVGTFQESVQAAPPADISIFGIGKEILCEPMRNRIRLTHTSCLFVQDSGMESALA
ncbi:MAG: Na-K-Cl cotransporter [Candidatus Latescibacteria bacterium]|nr:Na-K-Cl cotransporter [Candidatus Latescibacterota bacterium]